jgi:FecR protein
MLPRLALTLALAVFLCSPAVSPVFAQSPPPETETVAPAHVALVDGVATLEREGRSENPLNMPLLSGDRLKTADGRVEVLFADGSTLHLDRSTTIDVQSDDLIRLIDGRLRLNIPGPAREIAYRMDSPAGSVRISQAGEYRVAMLHSADETQLELAVVRGSGEIFTDQGTTPVRAGERAYASAGLAPSYAYAYNSANWDAFDRWSEERRDTRLGLSTQYLPSDMQPYASTFDQYGDWRYSQPYGYVWYPRVDVGWRPYFYGRWMSYPRFGWTWIGVDRFAWPTHHYGRWGFSAGVWFWIPGNRWAPAYVSWAYSGNYVSWCPLGFNNRPVISINIFNVGPRYYSAGFRYFPAWTVIERPFFGRGFVHDRFVNWDRRFDHNGRPAFELGRAAPVSPNVAVPRGSVPVRWAGTNPSSRTWADRGTGAPARTESGNGIQSRAGSRAESRTAVGDTSNAARTATPTRDTGIRRAQPATGAESGAAPRYVNRGDQIVRSPTERPSAPAPAGQGSRDGYAVPRGTRTVPTGPARRSAEPAPIDRTPGSRGESPMFDRAQPRGGQPDPSTGGGVSSPGYAPRYVPRNVPESRSAPDARTMPDSRGVAEPRNPYDARGAYGARSTYEPRSASEPRARTAEPSGAREAAPSREPGRAVERPGAREPRQAAPSSAPPPSRGGERAAPAQRPSGGGGNAAVPRRGRGGV